MSELKFLWPPRPENAIPPNMLKLVSNGKLAQVKKDGTCNVIAVGRGKIKFWTRHNEAHKAWKPTKEFEEKMIELAGDKTYIFVAELLHNKTPHIKHVNYFNDILVHADNYLVGVTFENRQKLLYEFFDASSGTEDYSHYIINENIWVARNFTNGFVQLFKRLSNPEDEGIVIKTANAELRDCMKQKANSAWQQKCRVTNKKHSF